MDHFSYKDTHTSSHKDTQPSGHKHIDTSGQKQIDTSGHKHIDTSGHKHIDISGHKDTKTQNLGHKEIDSLGHKETETDTERLGHKETERLGHKNSCSTDHKYRNYAIDTRVASTYRLNHTYQTVNFVRQKKQQHLEFNKGRLTIWQAIELLNNIVDESDPDLHLPQYVHAFQTAESLREKYPNEDWLHLVGLIHDLGKILSHPFYGNEPQWAVVGDTFPVGCAYSPEIVYSEYFQFNPDLKNPFYNSPGGIYAPHIGLDQVQFSWGHDEYMYQVCKHNQCTIPPQGLAIIRYHSFYAWHTKGQYTYLMDESDQEKLSWVQKFCQHDLYSKTGSWTPPLIAYYQQLIEKYFPQPMLQW